MSSPSPPQEQSADPTTGQKRKRLPRALLACESCRARKLRCDQSSPCSNCLKRSLDCHYRSLDIPLPSSAARQSDGPQETSLDFQTDDPNKRQSRPLAPLPTGRNSGSVFSSPYRSDTPVAATTSGGPIQYAQPGTRNERDQYAIELSNLTQEQDTESGADSFGEVNRHTQGTEFYGPTGIYSFLRRLRSRARTQGTRVAEKPDSRNTRDARDLSIVNLLHSSDFPISSPNPSRQAPTASSQPRPVQSAQGNSSHLPSPSPTFTSFKRTSISGSTSKTPAPSTGPFALLSNTDIEKECVRLYFQNLHLVHPILDQTTFTARCENEIWEPPPSPRTPIPGSHSVFLALFNAVLAIGAIIAGEDALFMRDMTTVRQAERYAGGSNQRAPTYPPLKLAKLFFERAKTHLGDVFEACSLESTQTLLLMAVFCQNALKPHSCYLYCGMAVRSALAIGLPNYTGPEAGQASALWWNLYSFEIEMCASAGRESSLRQPEHYRLPFPHILAPNDPKQAFTSQMIEMAQLMEQLSQEIYQLDNARALAERSNKCLEIDRRLVEWKRQLPPSLDFERTSLTEPEWISKQKVVLRNRFLNARILCHRPFLIAATTATDPTPYKVHVTTCVSASIETIEALYEMYKHRPYFRTWWYNTTYTLYASMILLYVVLSNVEAVNRDYVIRDVEKSLEIFGAMNMVTVARRCAEVTQEVLDIAKKSPQQPLDHSNSARPNLNESQHQQGTGAGVGTGDAGTAGVGLLTQESDLFASFEFSKEDLYASLVDSNLMDGFAPFENGYFDIPDFNSVLGSGPFS